VCYVSCSEAAAIAIIADFKYPSVYIASMATEKPVNVVTINGLATT
jgi:hypothetical protein